MNELNFDWNSRLPVMKETPQKMQSIMLDDLGASGKLGQYRGWTIQMDGSICRAHRNPADVIFFNHINVGGTKEEHQKVRTVMDAIDRAEEAWRAYEQAVVWIASEARGK